jgi:small subunit ribosomal protein S8|tara:strand:- start:47 stop:451 length:405 start_codon:yes stop_codon:yes gene_type:complete
MSNDTISDMLTRIRNANSIKHYLVEIPCTKMNSQISKILKEEGFIKNYEILTKDKEYKNTILIALNYLGKNKRPIIKVLKRISKPGNRKYTNAKNLPNVLGKLGIAIVSTSQGIMTSNKARQLNIGGEILCYIW